MKVVIVSKVNFDIKQINNVVSISYNAGNRHYIIEDSDGQQYNYSDESNMVQIITI